MENIKYYVSVYWNFLTVFLVVYSYSIFCYLFYDFCICFFHLLEFRNLGTLGKVRSFFPSRLSFHVENRNISVHRGSFEFFQVRNYCLLFEMWKVAFLNNCLLIFFRYSNTKMENDAGDLVDLYIPRKWWVKHVFLTENLFLFVELCQQFCKFLFTLFLLPKWFYNIWFSWCKISDWFNFCSVYFEV